jgi:hypothetical protein
MVVFQRQLPKKIEVSLDIRGAVIDRIVMVEKGFDQEDR